MSKPNNKGDQGEAQKKRKETAAKLSAMFASAKESNGKAELSEGNTFTPSSLAEIQVKVKELMDALPGVLPDVPEEVSACVVTGRP